MLALQVMLLNKVIVALLKVFNKINIGDRVVQTNEELQGEYSESSQGRIIDMFGIDKLTGKKYQDIKKLNLETDNIPIMDRTAVSRPLYTGIVGIDLIYPIGKGQRQLIIGDKKTGKTQLCLDTIVNKKIKMFYVYMSLLVKLKEKLKKFIMSY